MPLIRNGTFSAERQGMQRAGKSLVILLVIGFFCAATLWFIFVSGFWKVSFFEIQGLQMLDRGEVEKIAFTALDGGAWKPWDKRNIFYVDEKKLAEDLKSQLFAESVTVDKSYPNVLRLIIHEQQRSVVIASKDQLLDVDFNGYVKGELTGSEADKARSRLAGKALSDPTQPPVVIVDLPEMAVIGYQAANGTRIRQWLDVYSLLNASGVKSRYFRLSLTDAKTLYVRSDGNFFIIFDLFSDLAPQVDSYKRFMQVRPKDAAINEYIDVRVPGRVYVK
ncbi:MAG: hypothetical protein WC641_03645 [Patescibacteria group bacterium]